MLIGAAGGEEREEVGVVADARPDKENVDEVDGVPDFHFQVLVEAVAGHEDGEDGEENGRGSDHDEEEHEVEEHLEHHSDHSVAPAPID